MRIMETSARLLNPFLDELSDEFLSANVVKTCRKMWQNLLSE